MVRPRGDRFMGRRVPAQTNTCPQTPFDGCVSRIGRSRKLASQWPIVGLPILAVCATFLILLSAWQPGPSWRLGTRAREELSSFLTPPRDRKGAMAMCEHLLR